MPATPGNRIEQLEQLRQAIDSPDYKTDFYTAGDGIFIVTQKAGVYLCGSSKNHLYPLVHTASLVKNLKEHFPEEIKNGFIDCINKRTKYEGKVYFISNDLRAKLRDNYEFVIPEPQAFLPEYIIKMLNDIGRDKADTTIQTQGAGSAAAFPGLSLPDLSCMPEHQNPPAATQTTGIASAGRIPSPVSGYRGDDLGDIFLPSSPDFDADYFCPEAPLLDTPRSTPAADPNISEASTVTSDSESLAQYLCEDSNTFVTIDVLLEPAPAADATAMNPTKRTSTPPIPPFAQHRRTAPPLSAADEPNQNTILPPQTPSQPVASSWVARHGLPRGNTQPDTLPGAGLSMWR